jgi:hypothetical protein
MNHKDITSIISFWIGQKKPGFILTKPEYERLLHMSQLKHLKRKVGLPEEYLPGQPVPRQSFELTKVISDDVAPFKRIMGGKNMPLAVDENGYAPFPSDYFFPSTMELKLIKGTRTIVREIKIVSDKKWTERVGSFGSKPNKYFPISNIQNSFFRFYPKDIKFVDFVYISLPEKPVYGVSYARNFAEYSPNTSTELKWNDANIIDIIGILLGEIGISVDRADLVQLSDKAEGTGQ